MLGMFPWSVGRELGVQNSTRTLKRTQELLRSLTTKKSSAVCGLFVLGCASFHKHTRTRTHTSSLILAVLLVFCFPVFRLGCEVFFLRLLFFVVCGVDRVGSCVPAE